MRTSALLVCFALAFASCAREPPVPPELAGDFGTLREAKCFAVTYVGIGGELPPQIAAFGRIVAHPDAAQVFRRLLAEASGEGQLYALCGLFFADRAAFLQGVETLRSRERAVRTQAGCIASDSTLRRELPGIENGNTPIGISDCCPGWQARREQVGRPREKADEDKDLPAEKK